MVKAAAAAFLPLPPEKKTQSNIHHAHAPFDYHSITSSDDDNDNNNNDNDNCSSCSSFLSSSSTVPSIMMSSMQSLAARCCDAPGAPAARHAVTNFLAKITGSCCPCFRRKS